MSVSHLKKLVVGVEQKDFGTKIILERFEDDTWQEYLAGNDDHLHVAKIFGGRGEIDASLPPPVIWILTDRRKLVKRQ